MADITGAISGIATTFKVLRGAIDARDDALIRNAQIDMQQQLLEALSTAASQIQTVNALELEAQQLRTQLVQANALHQEAKRELKKRVAYKLAQPAPDKWAYVLASETGTSTETTTYFCATCYAEHLEVPMQYLGGNARTLRCTINGKHSIHIPGDTPPAPQRVVHDTGFGRAW